MQIRRLGLLVALAGLLLNGLGCYGAWTGNTEARKCCQSGHCSPANHDSCCKTAPDGSTQALLSKEPAQAQLPVVTVALVAQPLHAIGGGLAGEPMPVRANIHPPPLEFRTNSLPLLI